VSDLPVSLPDHAVPAFVAAFDRAGKIVRALDALGPVAARDVIVIDADHGPIIDGLGPLGARLVHAPLAMPFTIPYPSASADVVLGLWSAFRGVDPDATAEVDRVLRPGGRQLVVHDYGRDDVSKLSGERPEYGAWSHRTGPFLTAGFRVRVLHCFWEFDSSTAMHDFLDTAFGATGATLAASLARPRLSYNVAVYHRSRP
jgi:hypothetical protein